MTAFHATDKLRGGFEYDAVTKTARFSVYERNSRGRKRRRKTVHDVPYDDALKLWAAFRADARTGSLRKPTAVPTLREFVGQCMPAIRERMRKNTADDYDYALKKHLLPAFGHFRLDEITAGAVNKFSAGLARKKRRNGKRYAGATINNYVNILSALLGHAVALDVIEETPLKPRRILRFKEHKPTNELSDAARERFLAAFDDADGFDVFLRATMPRGEERLVVAGGKFGTRRVYGAAIRPGSEAARQYFARFQSSKDFFIVAIETGLRLGDLLDLRWSDVDLATGRITRHMLKTDRDVVIPLSDIAHEALTRRHENAEGAHVFMVDARPFNDSLVDRYFRIAKRIARIERLRFHDLRHTFGSRLASRGVPILFISGVMGHSSVVTTQRYARPDERALEGVRAALNEG